MTHRLLAGLALTGLGCDALGGFYLAYELLGGRHGPLRIVSSAITYASLSLPLFCLATGWRFGLVAGLGFGLALGVEYHRADEASRDDRRAENVAFALLRGAVLGVAAAAAVNFSFGAWFGALSAVALAGINLFGFSTTKDFARHELWGRLVFPSSCRAASIAIAAFVAEVATRQRGGAFAMKLGLSAGAISFVLGIASRTVQHRIESLPPRVLGATGAILVLIGFVLQSLQYLVVLTDASVR